MKRTFLAGKKVLFMHESCDESLNGLILSEARDKRDERLFKAADHRGLSVDGYMDFLSQTFERIHGVPSAYKGPRL